MTPWNDVWLVSSHFKEDVSWLSRSGVPFVVVSKGEEKPNVAEFHCVPNRGAEFGSYVWFVLNYWDNLPDKVAFVHGHETAYHQQFSILESLALFGDREFHGLNGDFSVAMHRLDREHVWFGDHFPQMWNYLGLSSVSPPPLAAVIQPGTQSVVSRELIMRRGRSFWENIMSALLSHPRHYHLALVLEIAWQMIFGVGSVNPSCRVLEFEQFFVLRNLSVLIAHPGRAWNSLMGPVVNFEPPPTKGEWVFRCLEIFRRFSGNSVDSEPYIDYN